jgi:UTP--glucose-1-phosphate uridylyltransferase
VSTSSNSIDPASGEPVDEASLRLVQRSGLPGPVRQALATAVREQLPADNVVRGQVTAPDASDLVALPEVGSSERKEWIARGEAAITAGEVAAVILAGGMATRFGGVVKAGVEAAGGRTFLDLKLADVRIAAERAGGVVPIALMTSFATSEEVRALAAPFDGPSTPVSVFEQCVSLRLSPDGSLFREADGTASPYAPGHGDLSFALRSSGVMAQLRARGVRILLVSNVDNLGATLDPLVIGGHLLLGGAITAETVKKDPGDRGGTPAKVGGLLQIVESFRFPEGFDQDAIPVFNTNTLLMDLDATDRDFDLTFFRVEKKVDGRTAIQHERLVGELTAFLPTRFLVVPRGGPDGRFQPVKDPDELARRRPDIEALLRARGVL